MGHIRFRFKLIMLVYWAQI